jgi:four helix bundle protein
MLNGVNDLISFRKSFKLAMDIFEISKSYPKEERYSLTDQIRRSSRAISANLAEAYCKRRYEPYFICKLFDADMENTETQVWLQFALKCNYLSNDVFRDYTTLYQARTIFTFLTKSPLAHSNRSVAI